MMRQRVEEFAYNIAAVGTVHCCSRYSRITRHFLLDTTIRPPTQNIRKTSKVIKVTKIHSFIFVLMTTVSRVAYCRTLTFRDYYCEAQEFE